MSNKKNKNKKNIFSFGLNGIMSFFKNISKTKKDETISLENTSFESENILKNDQNNFDLLKENARLYKVKNKILSKKKGEEFVDEHLNLQTNTAQFLFENIFEAEKLKEKLEELNLEKEIEVEIGDKDKKSYTLKFNDDNLKLEEKKENNLFSDFDYEKDFDFDSEENEEELKKKEQNNLNQDEIENESEILKKKENNVKFPFFLLKKREIEIKDQNANLIGKYERKINYILRNIDFPGEITKINSCSTFSTFTISLFKNFNLKDLYYFKSHFNKYFYKIKYRFDINKINQKILILEIKNYYYESFNFNNLLEKMHNDFFDEKLLLGENYKGELICKSLSKLFVIAQSKEKINFIHNLITSIIFKKSSNEIKFKIYLNQNVNLKYNLNFPYFIKSDKNKKYSLNDIIDIFDKRHELFIKNNVKSFEQYNNILIDEDKKIEKIVLVVSELNDILNNNDNFNLNKFTKIIEKGEKLGIYTILLTDKIFENNLSKMNLNLFKEEQKILFFKNKIQSNFYFFKKKEIDQLFLTGDFIISSQNELIHCQQAIISDKELDLINIYLKNFYNFKSEQKSIEIEEERFMEKESKKNQIKEEEILSKDDFLLKTAKIILCERKEINLQIIQSYMGIDYNKAYLVLNSLFKYKIISSIKNNNNYYKLINNEVCDEVKYF
ncbi:/ / hypothetical protein / 93649:95058 Forward [Candidatus Hepatoplasma crinochetorum]|uniref:FtsK gamma domain-containing protein n=1 Tax=Candidatus Hepatoplasma crinochetorum TaxID=295596 RepID=A0A0G7ZNC4_9MOLU|nr:/ / hypothetical protein / 93649:95058 Forward [Candidatus Hepatoplasma crinochetorum]